LATPIKKAISASQSLGSRPHTTTKPNDWCRAIGERLMTTLVERPAGYKAPQFAMPCQRKPPKKQTPQRSKRSPKRTAKTLPVTLFLKIAHNASTHPNTHSYFSPLMVETDIVVKKYVLTKKSASSIRIEDVLDGFIGHNVG
jgi:hypothetical protein